MHPRDEVSYAHDVSPPRAACAGRNRSGRANPLSANPKSEVDHASATTEPVQPSADDCARRPDTKEVHVRVPIPNYQYLDQLARRYGMRSLSAVVNFLIEYHREYRDAPTLGRALPPVKQPE